MQADRLAGRGLALASRGAPWKLAKADLDAAVAWAPWEPQIRRATGTAATMVLVSRFDSQAAIDGTDALSDVSATLPHDAVVASEDANLLLAAGIAAKDQRLLERAAGRFAAVERMDPNTGVPIAGEASALLALGKVDRAIERFERALELSPRYELAWQNLARAYKAVGRARDAAKAERRARQL